MVGLLKSDLDCGFDNNVKGRKGYSFTAFGVATAHQYFFWIIRTI